MKPTFLTNISRFRPLALALAVVFLAPACDDDDEEAPVQTPQAANILQLAVSNENLDILEAAALRAGSNITNVLSNTNNLTVFAPTDDAFRDYVDALNGAAARPSEADAITAINGLAPEAVAGILQYHVLGSRIPAANVPASAAVPTLAATGAANNAGRVFVRSSGGTVRVNNATVTTADVNASNGVVHLINSVLVPPTQNIVETAVGNDDLDLLVVALTKAGIGGTFTGAGPFTVFAPTDAAFIELVNDLNGAAAAPDEAGAAAFINGLTPEQVTTILVPTLQLHVLRNNVVAYAADVPTTAASLQTLNTNVNATVQNTGGTVTVRGGDATNSNVVIANVTTTNGVVHVINRVLRTS